MINMKQWVADTINNNERLAIPIMTHPGIELIGKKVIDAVTDGQTHFEAIRRLNEVYPASACTVIMDLTVEAEAFGAEIIFPKDEVPSVIGRLVYDYDSVNALKIPSLTTARVSEYLKANRLVAQNVTEKPVFGGCIGPYSLAGRLFDLTELMMAAYTESETVTLLLEKCTEYIAHYCQAMKQTGINGVIIAEPAAGLLSNEDCSQLSSKYIKQIVEKVQDENFMVILHNCGNTGHCTEAMLEVGAMAYHFGNKIDMLDALRKCPSDVLVMGNLDPVGVFKQSTAEEVYHLTKKLLEKTALYKNFIISSGCDVPPNVPMENIEAFYKALKNDSL